MAQTRRLRVALVYPPFGPLAIPALGLSYFAASLRERGHECRVFYWNLETVTALPGRDRAAQVELYKHLSGRGWFPFNDWLFTFALYGDEMAATDAVTEETLIGQLPEGAWPVTAAELMTFGRASVPRLVDQFADRLGGYDVVGVSTTFFQNIASLALARKLKERAPSPLVVLGGANCEGEMGRALFREFPFIDAIIAGEADEAFTAFIDGLASRTNIAVPGLMLRLPDGSELVGPPPRPAQTFDQLPPPDFDDFMIRLRTRMTAAETPATMIATTSPNWAFSPES